MTPGIPQSRIPLLPPTGPIDRSAPSEAATPAASSPTPAELYERLATLRHELAAIRAQQHALAGLSGWTDDQQATVMELEIRASDLEWQLAQLRAQRGAAGPALGPPFSRRATLDRPLTTSRESVTSSRSLPLTAGPRPPQRLERD